MAIALDGDMVEQARAYAEEERRRQREAEASRQRTLNETIAAQLANPDRNPEVVVDPYSDTGWSYRGTPVKDWTGAPVGNASADVLTRPAPPLADNGYGFEGQDWYVAPPEPEYTPVPPPYTPVPRSNAFADAGFGATTDMGLDRVQAEIDQRRALGDRFLPPSTEQRGRSNVFERAIGPVGDALREGFSTIDVGFAETGLDLVRPAVGAGGFGLARRDNREVFDESIGALAENARGGNPWDFLNRQEVDFNQRPIQEQLVGEVFKPSNWIGTGAVTKLLSGAGKGGGLAAKGARTGAAVNKALDVGQAKIAAPAIGAIGGYVANEAAGQPLEPYQAIGLGIATGMAAKPVLKGAKAAGRELATGRLAGETGAIDFTKLPALEGTPKQVAYAERIRAHALGQLDAVEEWMRLHPPRNENAADYNVAARAAAEALRQQLGSNKAEHVIDFGKDMFSYKVVNAFAPAEREGRLPKGAFRDLRRVAIAAGGPSGDPRLWPMERNVDVAKPIAKAEGESGLEVRPQPIERARETLAASDAAIRQADASIRAAGGNPPPLPERLPPAASGVTPPPPSAPIGGVLSEADLTPQEQFALRNGANFVEGAQQSARQGFGSAQVTAAIEDLDATRAKIAAAHGVPIESVPRPIREGPTAPALPPFRPTGPAEAPPPPRVPPTGTPPPPKPPRRLPTLDEIVHPNERPTTGLIRRYEGAVDTAGLELRREMDAGNKLLREAKIPGKWNGSRFEVQRTPEVEQLYKALHGEGTPPASLQRVYDYLKPLVDAETAKTVDFDPAFVPRDDYFYRGWKEVPVGKVQRAGTAKGQVGARPGYMKPRSDQTFSEILNTVYTKPDGTQVRLEPVSWNPLEQYGLRKAAGEQHRAQTELLDLLKESGNAVDASLAPDGWRVPHVGPAFEGKPFAYTPGAKTTNAMERLADEAQGARVGYTTRFAVPNKAADDIEAIFGRAPSFGRVGDFVLNAGQKTKQAKLFASLFQQMDFGARTLGSLTGGVIDEVAAAVEKAATMHPVQATQHLFQAGKQALKVPVELAKLPVANMSGARQAALRSSVLDAKPLFKERPGITLRGVSENGGKFGTDISMVTRDFMKDVRDAARPSWLKGNVATRRIQQLNAASQRGLFDGWYVQSQEIALRNQILPRLMRQHPDWTDAQIMGAAADQMNKMFSTLGNYQTFIKNPVIKKLTHALVFSTNESEALLRGAASTVVGPNKRLWTEFYLGTFVSLAAIAETVHYATTGEHLPLERLNPIDTENNFGPLPVGYRTNFLAPDIPLKGRGGTNMTIDTVMQMDTIFRLLDPKAFAQGRENVLPRTIQNQYTGKDFFGRELRGPKERIGQAATDLLEPIGVGQLRGALDIGPQNEARAGRLGQALQSLGPNVRAENNAQLRDRMAAEWATATGATKRDGSPIKGWGDLEPNQRTKALDYFPDFKAELQTRRDEAVASGQMEPSATDAIKAKYAPMQAALDAELEEGTKTASEWRDVRHDNILLARGEYEQAGKAFPPKKESEKTPLDRYYEAIDKATLPTGELDWDKVDAYEAGLSERDRGYIADNTGLTSTPTEKRYHEAAKRIEDSGYWDLKDKAFHEAVSKGWVKGDVQPQPGQTFYDWQEAVIAKYLPAFVDKYGPDIGPVRARQEVSSYKPIADFNDWYTEKQRPTWVMSHPEEAKLLLKWGYVDTFGKDGDAWLAKH